ncbi:MAG: hypothetical protein L0Y72_23750 [Gemmataceae bacterium]|nr:hypothetical protein [Gemmataceae bacterium]MCI0742059.1 hypothetical protein [Gemmataceae bacterium]
MNRFISIGVLALVFAADRLRADDGVITVNHGHPVWALAFSPDGKLLVTGSRKDSKAPIWDVASGKEVGRFGPFQSGVFALAFAPDGKTLAVATGDGNVRLCDYPSGKVGAELVGIQLPIEALVFSKGGKSLVAGCNRRETIAMTELLHWHLKNAQVKSSRKIPSLMTTSLSLTTDGHVPVASTRLENGKIRHCTQLLDLATAKDRLSLGDWHAVGIAALPEGERLVAVVRPNAAVGDQCLVLWDYAQEQELCRVKWLVERVVSPVFSSDGRFVASHGQPVGSHDKIGSLRLWETLTGSEVFQFGIQWVDSVNAAFSLNSRMLACGGRDGTVRIWDFAKVFGDNDKVANLWSDLQSDDAKKALQAQWRLSADPANTVPELVRRLNSNLDRMMVDRLFADLENESFAVRSRSADTLTKWTPELLPMLLPIKKTEKTLEFQRRVDQLLSECRRREQLPENLWRFRAIAILEHINTKESRAELKRLAQDAPGTLLMSEARLALMRCAQFSK